MYKPTQIKDIESAVKAAGFCFGIRIDSVPFSGVAHIVDGSNNHKPALCGKRPYRKGSPFRGGFIFSSVPDRVVCVNCLKSLRALRERQVEV